MEHSLISMVCMKGVLKYAVEMRAMHTLVPGVGTVLLYSYCNTIGNSITVTQLLTVR